MDKDLTNQTDDYLEDTLQQANELVRMQRDESIIKIEDKVGSNNINNKVSDSKIADNSIKKPSLKSRAWDITKAMIRTHTMTANIIDIATAPRDSNTAWYFQAPNILGIANGNENLAQQNFQANEEDLADIDSIYWPKLIAAKNPDEFKELKQKFIQQEKDNELLADTPWYVTLPIGVGVAAGEILATIPIGGIAAILPNLPKLALYNTPIKAAVMNIIKAFPKMTAGAYIYNLPSYINRVTKTTEEYLLGSFIDGAIGSALHGSGGVIKAWQYTKAKAAIAADYLDLKFVQVVNKWGKIVKTKVVPRESTIKGSSAPENMAMAPEEYVKKEMGIKDVNKLTGSEKERYDAFVKEIEQTRNLPTSELIKLKADGIEKLINNGIEDIGILGWGPLKSLLKASPTIRILYSPYATVRERLGQLFGHDIITGRMTSNELQEATTKLHASKQLIKSTKEYLKTLSDPIEKKEISNKIKELKKEAKLASNERKNILKNGSKDLVTYDGKPKLDFSVHTEIEDWMGRSNFAMVNARKEYHDFLGSSSVGKHLPFFEKIKAAKDFLTRTKNEPAAIWENFLEEISIAIQDNKHSNPHVWRAAQEYIKIDDALLKEIQNLGRLQHINPETKGYLHRMINQKAAKAKSDEFISVLEKALEARDLKNKQLRAPINALQKDAANLKREITKKENLLKKSGQPDTTTTKFIDDNKIKLEQITQEIIKQETELQSLIDTGKIPLTDAEIEAGLTQESLLGSRLVITKKMQTEYNELTKPLEELQIKLDKAKLDGDDVLKTELLKQKRELKKSNQEKLNSGTVDPNLTYKNKKGELKLKNLTKAKLASLAKPLKKEQYKSVARNIVNSYTGMNEEQLTESLFSSWLGIGEPNTSALKERTVLFGDNILRPFLEKNIVRVMDSHVNHLSKFIAIEKFFKQFSTDSIGGEESFIHALRDEHTTKKEILLRKPFSEKRTKSIEKLDKEFENAQVLIRESMQIIKGSYGAAKTNAERAIKVGVTVFKAWAFANMMGGVALFFPGDLVAPAIRYGFKHFKSLIPTLKQMFDIKAPRYMYADLNIGINALKSSLRDAMWGDFLPGSSPSRAARNMSKIASNLFLIDPLYDFSEVAATKTVEANLARNLERWFSKGRYEQAIDGSGKTYNKWVSDAKFTPKEIEYLNLMRFNFDKYGKRVQEMLKKYGEPHHGSIIPNTHLWSDLAAAAHYRKFARTRVNHLLNKTGPGDVPYCFKLPLVGMFMQFTSWGFGATNNYLIPTVQRPDLIKMQWATLSMLAGMTNGPLRDLLERREVDWNYKKLMWEGINNAGLAPWYMSQLSKYNTALKIPGLDWMQTSRHQQHKASEILLGPPGAILDTAVHLTSKFINGELTWKDFERGKRLLPWRRAFYFRPFQHNSIEEKAKRRKEIERKRKIEIAKKHKTKKKEDIQR